MQPIGTGLSGDMGSRDLPVLPNRICKLVQFFGGAKHPKRGSMTNIEMCLTMPESRTILDLETPQIL